MNKYKHLTNGALERQKELWKKWKSCERKLSWPTPEEALAYPRKPGKEHVAIRAYKCPHCNQFHRTHAPDTGPAKSSFNRNLNSK